MVKTDWETVQNKFKWSESFKLPPQPLPKFQIRQNVLRIVPKCIVGRTDLFNRDIRHFTRNANTRILIFKTVRTMI